MTTVTLSSHSPAPSISSMKEASPLLTAPSSSAAAARARDQVARPRGGRRQSMLDMPRSNLSGGPQNSFPPSSLMSCSVVPSHGGAR